MLNNTENTFNNRSLFFSYTQVHLLGAKNVMADRQVREPLSKILRRQWVTWRNAGILRINQNDRTRHMSRDISASLAADGTRLEVLNAEYVKQLYNDITW